MKTYPANRAITLQVPLVDSDGVGFSAPETVSAQVTDDAGDVLVPETALTPTTTEIQAVTVAIETNTLDVGVPFGFRKVRLIAVKDGAPIVVDTDYLIESATPLIVGVNSFQTLEKAALMSAGLADVDAWTAASRAMRIGALQNAFHALGHFTYQVDGVRYPNITALDPTVFADFNSVFLRQLRLAQIVEANEALGGNTVSKKRRDGIMSETIGESSMMFRPEKVLNVPVTKRSMQLLRRYIVWEMSVGRG
jgi:hypothetical protein